MATLYKRLRKDKSFSWRVEFRRKNYPTFIITFETLEEAIKFIDENEEKFIMNPQHFTNIKLKEKMKENGLRKMKRRKYLNEDSQYI